MIILNCTTGGIFVRARKFVILFIFWKEGACSSCIIHIVNESTTLIVSCQRNNEQDRIHSVEAMHPFFPFVPLSSNIHDLSMNLSVITFAIAFFRQVSKRG